MIKWPRWLYKILFLGKGINWSFNFRKLYTFGQIMHFSPIDSSFTYCRIGIFVGDLYIFPIVCTADYPSNVGMELRLFHRNIFDNTAFSKRIMIKRNSKQRGL